MSNTYVGNDVFVQAINNLPVIIPFLATGLEYLSPLNLNEISTSISLLQNKLKSEYGFYATPLVQYAPQAITLAHILKRLVIQHNNSNILAVAEYIGRTYRVKPSDALIVFQLVGEMSIPVFTNAGVVIMQFAYHMAIFRDSHIHLMTASCRISPILTQIRDLRQELIDAGLGRNAVTDALKNQSDSYIKDH